MKKNIKNMLFFGPVALLASNCTMQKAVMNDPKELGNHYQPNCSIIENVLDNAIDFDWISQLPSNNDRIEGLIKRGCAYIQETNRALELIKKVAEEIPAQGELCHKNYNKTALLKLKQIVIVFQEYIIIGITPNVYNELYNATEAIEDFHCNRQVFVTKKDTLQYLKKTYKEVIEKNMQEVSEEFF